MPHAASCGRRSIRRTSARAARRGSSFPNFQIGHALNNALCYSARPYGYNPDKCIFEAAVYELFPKGEEPKTEWQYTPADDAGWRRFCRRTSRIWRRFSKA